jgi:twitching motility protein PilT
MDKPLDQVLLERGMVSPYELRPAIEEERRTGKSLWQVLLDRGVLGERELTKARAAQVGEEFVDVTGVNPAPDAVAMLPEDVARRCAALPLRVENGAILVALAELRDAQTVTEIATITGKRVTTSLAVRGDLLAALDRAYRQRTPLAPPPGAPGAPPPGAAVPSVAGPMPEAVPGVADAGGLEQVAPVYDPAPFHPAPVGVSALAPEDVPMVEITPDRPPEVLDPEGKEPRLGEFLDAVIDLGGSDLHLTAGLPPTVRINGELQPVKGYRALQHKDLQDIVYSMITQRQREHFEDNLELDVSYSLPGRGRFRVNVFQQRDSLGSVMRLIPHELKSVEQLGLPPVVGEFAKLRRGLVLVTGITGSGKSTTLAGLVDSINSTRAEHIMTVEDPIEFLHKHKKAVVNQREVGTDTHGFAAALKHVLRQDPDVILVGEMRDLETISTALTAAETGHLVFGTLHTQDAPQSIDRVIDVFPPHQQEQIRIQLAGTLAGVVSQQLVPNADGKGRAVAAEVLIAIPAVQNLIREGKTHQIYTSMQSGGKFGMQVMDQHLAELVKRGRVTYEGALERCHRVEEFSRLVGKG